MASSKAEGRDGANDAKDVVRQKRDGISHFGIELQKSKSRARSRDDLLLFGACELAQQRLCDCGRRLDRQRVHEHVRRGRHGCRRAQEARAALLWVGSTSQMVMRCWVARKGIMSSMRNKS